MAETKKKVVAKKKVGTKSEAGTKSTARKKAVSKKKVATKKKTGAKTKAGTKSTSKKKTTSKKKVAVQTKAGTKSASRKKTASGKKVATKGKNENKSQVADKPTSSAKAVSPKEPEIRELSKVESVSDDPSRKTPVPLPSPRASGVPPVPVPNKHKTSLSDGRQNGDWAPVGPPRPPPISAVPPRPPEHAVGRSKMNGGRARLSTPPPLPRGRIVGESSNPADSSSSTVSEDARTVVLNQVQEPDFPDDSYSTQSMLSETTYTGLLTSDIEVLDNESQDGQNEDSSESTRDSGSGLRRALSQKMSELSKSPKKWKETILSIFKGEEK